MRVSSHSTKGSSGFNTGSDHGNSHVTITTKTYSAISVIPSTVSVVKMILVAAVIAAVKARRPPMYVNK